MRIRFNGVGQSRALALLVAAMCVAPALAGPKPEVASQVSYTSERAVYSDSNISIKYKVRRDSERIVVAFSVTNESAAPAAFQFTFSGASLRTNRTMVVAMGGGMAPPGAVWHTILAISKTDLPFKARLINIKPCNLAPVRAAPENTFVDTCAGVKSESSAEFIVE